MDTREKNKKFDEIKVLDKGNNMYDPIILIAPCCGGVFIPFRMA